MFVAVRYAPHPTVKRLGEMFEVLHAELLACIQKRGNVFLLNLYEYCKIVVAMA